MRRSMICKSFVYLLCVSFLVMMSGFPRAIAEVKEKNVPIGEMVSNGGVKFEARENVWKEAESSHFPIFQGTRIKTEQGIAVVTLSNNSQIEVSSNSLFSIDRDARFSLTQGSIEFHIPSASEINFKVGHLSVLKSRALQAAKDLSLAFAKSEETMGSITIHANGSVSIKSTQGKLTIMNKDQVVLAALLSKDSVTIPSNSVGVKPPVMVAQVGTVGAGTGTFLGVSTGTALLIGAGALVLAGGIVWAVRDTTKTEEAPVCP